MRQQSAVVAAGRRHLRSDQAMVAIFVVASFLGSGLLFLVQPMVARMLLPLVGGTPSLWNTAMVFFQLALLAGYAYAHVSTRRLGMRRHPIVQGVLLVLPLAVLPVSVAEGWRLPAETSPMVWVLVVLALIVGLPFFVLSTSSPTLQRWFAATAHPAADDPYFLYAAGNLGSVLALISYPIVLEPLLSLGDQARLWAMLYAVFVAVSIAAAWMTRRYRSTEPAGPAAESSPPIAAPRRIRWLLWSFVPSALMLGVTRHIATDVASVPLLWIIPLLLYLTTFIIAFGNESTRRTPLASLVVRFGAIPLVLSFVLTNWTVQMGIHLVWFFFAALLGHSRLADDRPSPDRLTEFYLWISVGGVAGGIFAALLAPVVFSTVLEYPIAIALALLMTVPFARAIAVPARIPALLVAGLMVLAWVARTQGLRTLTVLLVLIALANAAAAFRPAGPVAGAVAVALVFVLLATVGSGVLAQERSFFGVYRVEETGNGTRALASGTTNHGTQRIEEIAMSLEPTSYYHPASPIGQVMDSGRARRSVGIVGLGVGGLAGYGRPGDMYTFFEIDPVVVEFAENTEYFTYLAGTQASVDVVVGDGRLSLADSTETFDLLVMDAFNSDAIPIHLVTVEAIESYLERLADGGILAVHISNRHFSLAPVLGRAAVELGLEGRRQFHRPADEERAAGALPSHWVLLAADASVLSWTDGRWEPLPTDGPLWTDDYSDILRVMRF